MARVMNGHLRIAPTADVIIDDSALQGPTIGGSGILAIIGECTGGQPQTPIRYNNPANAISQLKSGPLVDAIRRAFAPAPTIPGAPAIFAVRVNPATKATSTLLNSATVVMNLASRDWGVSQNQIRLKVEAGTDTTNISRKITIENNGVSRIVDNIFRKGIQVRYTRPSSGGGNDYTATVQVTTADHVVGIVLNASSVVQSAEGFDLDLDLYPTMGSVIDAINAQTSGKWSAALSGPTLVDPSVYLDHMAAAANVQVTSPSTTMTELRSNWQAVYDFINRSSADIMATVGAARLPVDTFSGYHYLAGGAEGTPSTNDWQACFDALSPVDLSIVTVASYNQTILDMLKAHIDQASDARAERVCILGGDAGETIQNAKDRAARYRSPRVMVVYPGLIDAAPSATVIGATQAIPPWLVAAQLGGMFCGGGVANALTHRYIAAQGVEVRLTASQIDDLLESGVAPLELKQTRGVWVVQSRTAWNLDTNYRKNEMSCMRASDELVKRIRQSADEQLVGRTVGPGLLRASIALIESELDTAWRNGIIVGNTARDAYKNIQAHASGDFLQMSFECAFAIPANYVEITAHLLPFDGTLTA